MPEITSDPSRGSIRRGSSRRARRTQRRAQTRYAPSPPRTYQPTPVVRRTDEARTKQRRYESKVGRQPTPVVRVTDKDRAKARKYKQEKARAHKQERAKRKLVRPGGRYVQGVSGIDVKDIVTPALKVLDESTRAAEFVTGSADYQIRRLKSGKLPTPRGAVRAGVRSGVTREDRKTGSDVLKTAGVKNKAVRTGAGLAIDIAADPLTYATFGVGAAPKAAGSVAAKAAQKAGAKAEARAVAQGATRKQARKRASKAARRAWSEAPKNRGVTVGVAGRQTSGRASGAALSVLKPASKTKPGRKLQEARDTSSRLTRTRPRDIPEDEWNRLKAADRERRGTIMHGTRRVARRGRAIRKEVGKRKLKLSLREPYAKRIPEETSKRIRDAIEAGDLSTLTAKERRAAQALQREQEKLLKMRRESGEKASRYKPRSEDEPKGYVYRQSIREIDDPKLKKAVVKAQPARRTTTLKDFQRGDRRPMATVRETSPGKFVEDLETTLRVKGQKDVGRAANTRYRNTVMETGRTLKPSSKWDPETEGVFAVRDGRLVDVSKETFAKSEVVILKRSVADHANETMRTMKRIPFLDAATSKIKWVLTIPNPQYWARNAYGGTYMAWQSGVNAPSIARNAPTAVRLNRRITKTQRAEESLTKGPPKLGRVAVLPKGQTMDADEFVRELERVNISGGGQTNELLGAEFRRRGKAQGAEDFPRLVAYIHWRRKGHSPEESARRTLQSQIDYGDLPFAEREVARRFFPFYTFRSRNVVHQGRTILQRPGKFATTEKIRDTLASTAGLGENWQDALQEGEKAGVPIPTPFEIDVPGLGKQPVLLYPGLPITDVNLFTINPAALGQQVASSVHPLLKSPVEFWTGYNFFWRDQIEQSGNRWVAAPDELIDNLPKPMKKALVDRGLIRMGKDRWTGKWTWHWRGKADYLAKLTPISSTALQTATSSRSRKGQSGGMRALGWLTGVRPQPYDPKKNAYYKLLDEIGKLETRKDDLIELRVHKKKGWNSEKHSGESGWDTPEYARVKDRLDRMYKAKWELEGELDKKDRAKPQGVSAPPKSHAEEAREFLRKQKEGSSYAEEARKWLEEN